MSNFSEDPVKQAQYKEYKLAQTVFKNAIEAVMAGKKEEFESVLNTFLRDNAHVTALDFLKEFKSEGKTLVHLTATSGYPHILESLFDVLKQDKKAISSIVNLTDNQGFTPLMNATISESLEMMRILVKNGASVNMRNNDGAGAIHFAAGDASMERLIFLHENKADFDASSSGGTPLHWAAGAQDTGEAVAFVASHCSDVNAPNQEGAPAILTAAAAGRDKNVQALVKAGADIGSIYQGQLTLLHICAENGLQGAVDEICHTEQGKKCIALETVDGNLPIHLAAMVDHIDIVNTLLKYCKNLNIQSVMNMSVDEIIKESKVRLKQWEEKYGRNGTGNDNFKTEDITLEPAKDATAAAEADRLKLEGNVYFKQKQYETAIDLYTRALQHQGDNKAIWSNRSACFLSMKEFQKALHDAEICRRLDPTWTKGCYRLAAARLAVGNYTEAAVAAFEGCKLDESNQELKSLMQKAVKLGQEEEKKKRDAAAAAVASRRHN